MNKVRRLTAEEIREVRERFAESQRAFAERVGTSFEVIHRWETGKAKPRPMSNQRLLQLVDEADRIGL